MKKSYLRTFVTLLIVGAILLAIGLLAPLVYIQSNDLGPVCALAQSADGNGYVYYFDEPISYANLFWTQFNGLWASLTLLGCAMVLSSAFALIFHKFVSNFIRKIIVSF